MFRFAHYAALTGFCSLIALAPLAHAEERWWSPGESRSFPASVDYTNPTGTLRTLNLAGEVDVTTHPFFSPLGSNGRACVTCHQPSDSMSVSLETIRRRWQDTGGKDPIFAATDGSNCPSLPQAERASHSLLLDRGLFRIARPWPPTTWDGKRVTPEFTIEVVRDPTGCNTSATLGLKSATPTISVYRRPRPVTNLKYLTSIGFVTDPKSGLALPRDPATGKQINGNLMADARVRTLEAQARDAMRTHLQVTGVPDEAVVRKLVSFESQLFTAQAVDRVGGPLDAAGAKGGPALLAESRAAVLANNGVWSEYASWERFAATDAGDAAQIAFRQSVARGARVFRERSFLINDSAGINFGPGFGNPVRNSCQFCHNMAQMGNDVAPGQVDLGTTTEPYANPSPELPLFRVTCSGKPHPHYGKVIYTQDPGFALSTGKCADVGKITLQSMRGLAARAPYFSNGSAANLHEVIDYYNRRYNIGYSEQEKQDLVNLMSVL